MKKIRPVHKVTFFFLLIIFIGSLILTLPICSKSGQWTNYLTALFDACNAVCVTGVEINAIKDYYNFFGQLIILLLVQVGGLGFMTITSLMLVLIGRKLSFKDRLSIQESLNVDSLKGIVTFIKNITFLTLIIEAIGAIIIMFILLPERGVNAMWEAIFTSINAFCNAGYSLFNNSMQDYQSNPLFLTIIMLLTLLGSVGFLVIIDYYRHYRYKSKLTLHSKIVVSFTIGILLFSWGLYLIAEFNNKASIGSMSLIDKLFNSLFQTISARTAGYYTFDQTKLTSAGRFLNDILMFIGSSPGSTGGGVRITTIAILLCTLIASLRNANNVNVGKYTLEQRNIIKALSVFLLGIITVITLVFALLISENGNNAIAVFGQSNLETIIHNSVSIFANAGQLNASGYSTAGRIIIMIGMFVGRIGLLTFSLMFINPRRNDITYPSGQILVG